MDAGNDIAAKVAKQAVNAMMGDIVSVISGAAVLIAVVVGLFVLIVLFSRKRRRRASSRPRKSSRGRGKRR